MNIVIKDPRLTFFVPFLKEVCIDYGCKFIFCTRDKEECVNSLSKAQTKSTDVCSDLYDKTHRWYNDNYLKVDHRDLLFNNKETMNKISNFCNVSMTTDTSDIVDMMLYRHANNNK